VDYHEASGIGLDEYARILEDKRQQYGWIYGYHFFPHDVEHRELGNRGLSRRDTLRGLGINIKVVPQSSVNDGINAARRMLDATWIDAKRCERGLNALRNYSRSWNEKTKMFSDAPKHDWASHGADALRTFACGYRDAKEKVSVTGKIPTFNTAGRNASHGWMAR